MYLFRLSRIGQKFDEVNLQFAKTALLAILYTIWMVFELVLSPSLLPVSSPFAWLLSGSALTVLMYSALGPGTIADVSQQQGQKYVSASEANVILSMEPVFAALTAWLVLGEVTTVQELIGGGIILLAALIATR